MRHPIVALYAAVCVRLAMRLTGSSHLMRRTLAPVLGAAIFRLASGAEPATTRTLAGEEVLAPPGERPPADGQP